MFANLAFGLKGMAIAALVSGALSFAGGVWVRDAFCDAAAAKIEVKGLKTDVKAATDLNARASDHASAIETASDVNREIERDTLTELSKRAADARCLLGDDGARRLRSLQ